MSMFDNYDNISPNYIPDNSSPTLKVGLKSYDTSLPKELYNQKREFIGYLFNEGDTLSIDTRLTVKVSVEIDAIVYNEPNQKPSKTTEGYVGKKAYNTVDFKSFTCIEVSRASADEVEYIWKEDSVFQYPSVGEIETIFTPYSKYTDVKLNILNFRYDIIASFDLTSNQAEFYIDENTSNLMLQGVYSVEVYVSNESERRLATKYKLIVGNVDMNELNKNSLIEVPLYSGSTREFILNKLNAILKSMEDRALTIEKAVEELDAAIDAESEARKTADDTLISETTEVLDSLSEEAST